jgi:hypothetical protein
MGHRRLPTPPDKITGKSMLYILTPKMGATLEQFASIGFRTLSMTWSSCSGDALKFDLDDPRLDMSLSTFKMHGICG